MATSGEKGTPRGVADGRCFCSRCTSRTEDIYRMVGRCSNCGSDVLCIYRAGDKAAPLECPTCEVYRAVTPQRLATPDEVPADWSDSGPSASGRPT
jgi:transcription elongation factor Elf1